MALSELLKARSNVLLVSVECDAHQSIYIPAMIEKHQSVGEFGLAVRRYDCPFCGVKGQCQYTEPMEWVCYV
jgi:hypothetical protein